MSENTIEEARREVESHLVEHIGDETHPQAKCCLPVIDAYALTTLANLSGTPPAHRGTGMNTIEEAHGALIAILANVVKESAYDDDGEYKMAVEAARTLALAVHEADCWFCESLKQHGSTSGRCATRQRILALGSNAPQQPHGGAEPP